MKNSFPSKKQSLTRKAAKLDRQLTILQVLLFLITCMLIAWGGTSYVLGAVMGVLTGPMPLDWRVVAIIVITALLGGMPAFIGVTLGFPVLLLFKHWHLISDALSND